ncbi:MAG TPA: hypothetical protein VGM97_12385 [Steroidobacteraceae bacterium]|jgi:chromosome segregation ATPase
MATKARSKIGLLAAVVTLIAGVSGAAHAQTARSGGGASAEMMLQLQQLTSERTALQSQNDGLKKQLDDMRKERDALKGAQGSIDQRARASALALTQSSAQRDALQKELDDTKTKMQELVDKFRGTIQSLHDTESDRTTVKQTLATREQQLKVCVDHNQQLYKLNDEVLKHLDGQTAWTRLEAKEPFTRLKRVQLENLADDFRARATDQVVTEKSLESTSGAPPH